MSTNTKKNKNKSKQNKPQSSNKTETTVEVDNDKSKPVDVKCEMKSDERVPEIVSEVVEQPVSAKEEDSPKKPKRNRGKKKKNEKEDLIDDGEELKKEENTGKDKPVEETKCDPETAPIDGKEGIVDTKIAPNAHKKKNKKDNKEGNKNIPVEQKEPTSKFEVIADHPLKITKLTQSEAETIMSDVKMITCVPIHGDQEKKKKNKKKKRTDSEKSEKEEISCTSAFQKLLEPREDKKETTKNDDISVETKAIENFVGEKPKNVVEKVTLDMILKETKIETDHTRDLVQEISKDSKDDTGKGKKKNKKDKQHTKSESEDECSKTPEPKKETPKIREPKIETQELILKEEIDKNKSLEVLQSSPTKPSVDKIDPAKMPKIEAPGSPKLKAKLAKQVENKSKDFKSEPVCENITESKSERMCKSKEMDIKSTFEEIIKLPVKEETKKTADLRAQVIIEEDIKTTENIQVIDSSLQKKRKKSPKPQRVEEIKIEDKMFQKALAETKNEPDKEQKTSNPMTQTKEDAKVTEKKETIEKVTKAAFELIMDPAKSLEKEQKKLAEAKPIPLPFTETIKTDEIQKPADTLKLAKMLKPAEIQKPEAEIQESEPEIKEITKGKLVQDAKNIGQVTESEQFDRIPTPDGGMGKKRKKSPKPQRKQYDSKTQESKDSESKEESTTSDNNTKTVTKDAISKTDDIIQQSPAEFKMLKDNLLKETPGKTLVATGIVTDTNPGSLVSEDENPGVLLLRKLASPLPMIKSSGETPSPKPDVVARDKPKSVEYTEEPLQKDDKKIKESEKPESKKASDKSKPVKDTTETLQHEVKKSDTKQIKSLEKTESKKTSELLESVKSSEISKPVKDNIETQKEQGKVTTQRTDLKSKMMEVNQDMEGLRKSIEKSLAELSVIDKSEKSKDQQFLEAQSKMQEIKDLSIKQQSNIKEQAKLTTITKVDEAKSSKNEKLDEKNSPMNVMLQKESVKPETHQSVNIAPIALPKTESPITAPAEGKSEEVHEVSKTPEPPKRDYKGKGKSKKKSKETEEGGSQTSTTTATATGSTKDTKSSAQEGSKGENTEQKGQSKEKIEQKGQSQSQEKGKQQSSVHESTEFGQKPSTNKSDNKKDFEQIENFEALTSSVDSESKSFELIMQESNYNINKPGINMTGPSREEKYEGKQPDNVSPEEIEKSDKQSKTNPVPEERDKTGEQSKNNPVSPPKNLLGHPSIPVRSNKMDYKKEKNKTPNSLNARVKIKDSVSIEKRKESKDTQTENKQKIINDKSAKESISTIISDNEEYVYKYSFRKVYLPSACHVCKVDLKQDRTPCNYCNLVFYCSTKHMDEDLNQHKALCFAVSTIVKLKDEMHIYAKTSNITDHDYRLLRMQMIVGCEKVLQRRLTPCEQEMLLYPRICADPSCREWSQDKLVDCDGCRQISYCTSIPRHFPPSHQRWCKSYALYHKLVCYQQTKGRLDPGLPTRVIKGPYNIPDNMNEVLAALYEEKIDMSDIQYAALTQIATAPLTAAYLHQLYAIQHDKHDNNGGQKTTTFTIHVVGAELQFEADVLNKWEVFYLHLRPDITELRVVLIGAELNPAQLPLELLGKIRLCEHCRNNNRRVVLEFQDKRSYSEYWATDFTTPDLVCAFNPSIQRSSAYNGKDPWPSTIKCIIKQKVPFIVTSYTMNELHRDMKRIKDISDLNFNLNCISEPGLNGFASVRPDRNFISDDEMPLLFKNYCCMMVCGDS